jgi:hypothetical protein
MRASFQPGDMMAALKGAKRGAKPAVGIIMGSQSD